MRAWAIFVVTAALLFSARAAQAFCGFYVAGADKQLYNHATQVVLMRDGTRTVLSMQNDYKGPLEDFAMVVPVPVVLQKEDVKTLPHDVFHHLVAPDQRGAQGDCTHLQGLFVDRPHHVRDERALLEASALELLVRPLEKVEQLRRTHATVQIHRVEVEGLLLRLLGFVGRFRVRRCRCLLLGSRRRRSRSPLLLRLRRRG